MTDFQDDFEYEHDDGELSEDPLEVTSVFDDQPAADAGGTPVVDYGSLPVSGDTAALMQQINGQLALAREIAGGTTDPGVVGISSSVQDGLDLLHNTYTASPATLNWLNGMNNGFAAYGEISNDVHRWELGYPERGYDD
jgi:hypothetical protein